MFAKTLSRKLPTKVKTTCITYNTLMRAIKSAANFKKSGIHCTVNTVDWSVTFKSDDFYKLTGVQKGMDLGFITKISSSNNGS